MKNDLYGLYCSTSLKFLALATEPDGCLDGYTIGKGCAKTIMRIKETTECCGKKMEQY